MSFLTFILIPVTTALAACLSMLIALIATKRQAMIAAKAEFASLGSSLQTTAPQFEEEVEVLLDEKLERTIEAFKAKIPLAGMFLSKEKEASLKEVARNELMKAVPSLKAKLFSGETSGVAGALIHPLVNNVCRRLAWRLFGVCAVVGFLFGLLQVAVLYFSGF